VDRLQINPVSRVFKGGFRICRRGSKHFLGTGGFIFLVLYFDFHLPLTCFRYQRVVTNTRKGILRFATDYYKKCYYGDIDCVVHNLTVVNGRECRSLLGCSIIYQVVHEAQSALAWGSTPPKHRSGGGNTCIISMFVEYLYRRDPVDPMKAATHEGVCYPMSQRLWRQSWHIYWHQDL
jgi:hypothetical protein